MRRPSTQGARLSPGLHHVIPFLGLVITLVGIADGVSWLLIGESFVPPPLCLVPIALGVALYRRYITRATRGQRVP